jgi:tetratricopeptide (TPR) repeat protein
MWRRLIAWVSYPQVRRQVRLGFAAMERQAWAEAIGHAREALLRDERHAPAHALKAVALDRFGLADEALHAVEMALTIQARSADLHHTQALILFGMGHYDLCLQATNRALSLLNRRAPRRRSHLYGLKAACLWGLGRVAEAREIAALGLSEAPDPQLREILGDIHRYLD